MQISGGLFLYNSLLQNFVQLLPVTSTLKFDICPIHLARPLCSAWALPPSRHLEIASRKKFRSIIEFTSFISLFSQVVMSYPLPNV